MRILNAIVCFLVLSAYAVGDEPKTAGRNGGEKHAGLNRFKQLAGEWEGKEVAGHEAGADVRASYKVTSAGSAVAETLFPGTPHEMITMIHEDGDALVLTHYCALGNQPHLKASDKAEGDQIVFKFAGGTNMKSDKDPHMHEVTYTFIDNNTFKSEWTHYNDGAAAGKAVFEFKRKK
jgi:hypothetical protein